MAAAFHRETILAETAALNHIIAEGDKAVKKIGEEATTKSVATILHRCRSRSLKAAIDSLASALREWRREIDALEDTEGTKEAKEALERMAKDPAGFATELATARALLPKLDNALDKRGWLEDDDNSSSTGHSGHHQAPLELPKWKIPKFDGDVRRWAAFWAIFEPCIHGRADIPDVRKMAIFHSLQTGRAYAALAGYAITGANYSTVVELFKRRFGDPRLLGATLHNELLALAKPAHTVAAMTQFVDDTERLCVQLTALGEETGNSGSLSSILQSKMPDQMREELLEKELDSGEMWSTDELRRRIQHYVQIKSLARDSKMESSKPPALHKFPQEKRNQKRRGQYSPPPPATTETRAFAVATTPAPQQQQRPRTPKWPCLFCGREGHYSYACRTHAAVDDRRRILRDKGLCYVCVRPGHSAAACPSGFRCKRCESANHHTVICPKDSSMQGSSSNGSGGPPGHRGSGGGGKGGSRGGEGGGSSSRRGNPASSANAVHAAPAVQHFPPQQQPQRQAARQPQPQAPHFTPVLTSSQISGAKDAPTLLMARTATVQATTPQGGRSTATLFFDSGSELSWISYSLARSLKLRRAGTHDLLLQTFQAERPTPLRARYYYIDVLAPRDGVPPQRLIVVGTESIVKDVTSVQLNDSQEVKPLPQPTKLSPDILIGAGDWPQMVGAVTKVGPDFLKFDTFVGPVIMGRSATTTTALSISATSPNDGPDLRELWALEAVGIKEDPVADDEDDTAQRHFETTAKVEKGRHVVALPWREDMRHRLQNGFQLAYHRLLATATRLAPELLHKCDQRVRDYVAEGIIEPAQRTNEEGEHFLPHCPVVTVKEGETKVRLTQDASARSRASPSLNECLYKGPVQLNNLVGMLLRLRLPPIAVLCDIEKAFLMVEVAETDREALKFLWPVDLSRPLSPSNVGVWRFRRLPFGLVCSPWLLYAVLSKHLAKHASPTAQIMQRNFYVDNLLLAAHDKEDALLQSKCAKAIMASAKMNLREWVSNEPAVPAAFPSDEQLKGATHKALGVSWNTGSDTLSITFPVSPVGNCTKRKALRVLASVYDPMGWACPALLPIKRFIQQLWESEMGWDDPFSTVVDQEWCSLIDHWPGATISVPRRATPSLRARHQLHCCTDASTLAMGCVVYLRSEQPETAPTVSLLFAKSRVVPRKGISTPRSELTALLLGTRALHFIKAQLGDSITVDGEWLWTDSTCVLHWVNEPTQQGAYVSKQLEKIRRSSEAEFRHIPTEQNPADVASRGCTVPELLSHPLWWHGPNWLAQGENCWPANLIVLRWNAPTAPPTTTTTTATTAEDSVAPTSILNPLRYGEWRNALRTMLRVLHFARRLVWPPTAADYKKAEVLLLKQAQLQPPTHEDAIKWGLQVCEDGLWRQVTRLINMPGTGFSTPIFVPHGQWLTLLARHTHSRMMHAGGDSTTTAFLQRFWTPQPHRHIKAAIRSCTHCQRMRATPFPLPPMPPLPLERVARSRPFEHVGVDYLGPTYATNGNKEQSKAWILLWTCLATRAVHLQAVASLDTTTYLLAFREMISRRGTPSSVISDNGSQLVLGARTAEARGKEREDYLHFQRTTRHQGALDFCARQRIVWRQIPQLTPWAGGVYERLVQNTKKSFKATLGRRVLPFEELRVFTAEVEACLNSRPISHISNEAGVPTPLRPIDFVSPTVELDPLFGMSADDDEHLATGRLSNEEQLRAWWSAGTRRLNHFWKRWSREYLLLLRDRRQTAHLGPHLQAHLRPKVGQVVLLEQDFMPRNLWPLGLITKLSPSESPRTAVVRTKGGRQLTRPLSLLYPLESCLTEDSSQQTCKEAPLASHTTHKAIGATSPRSGVDGEFPRRANTSNSDERREESDESHSLAGELPHSAPPMTTGRQPRAAKTQAMRRAAAHFAQGLCIFTFFAYLPGGGGFAPLGQALLEHVLPTVPPPPHLYCNECTAVCSPAGISVHSPPSVLKVEACCEIGWAKREECFVLSSNDGEIRLPPSVSTQRHECKVVWRGVNGATFNANLDCAAVDHCELLACWCCTEAINCHPRVAVFMLGLLLSVMVRALCGILSRCRTGCLNCCWLWNICCRRRSPPPDDEEWVLYDQRLGEEGVRMQRKKRPKHSNRRFPPLFGRDRVALAMVAALTLSHLASATTIVSGHSERCLADANGTTTCQTQFSATLTLLPRGQDTTLLVRHPTNPGVEGRLTLATAIEQLHCAKSSRGFSYSHSIHQANALRCPGAGLCSDDHCDRLHFSDKVAEMADNNAHPGFAMCQASTCAGAYCLPDAVCAHPSLPACLLTRVFAKPLPSNRTVEWFSCSRWRPALRLALRSETGEHVEGTAVDVAPGFATSWGNWTITVFPGGREPSPLFSALFVTDGRLFALAEHLPQGLFCPSREAALTHNCSLPTTVCSRCHATSHAKTSCLCRGDDWDLVFADPYRVLPISTATGILRHNHERMWLEVPATPYQITVTGSWALALVEPNTTCEVTPLTLEGYYASASCANFTYTCTTTMGAALGHVDCGNATLEVSCDTLAATRQALFCFDAALVDLRCTTHCPGGTTRFRLQGELRYLAAHESDYEQVMSEKIDVEEDLLTQLQRWMAAVKELLKYLPYLMGCLIVMAGMAALAVVVAKLRIYARLLRILIGALLATTVSNVATVSAWQGEPSTKVPLHRRDCIRLMAAQRYSSAAAAAKQQRAPIKGSPLLIFAAALGRSCAGPMGGMNRSEEQLLLNTKAVMWHSLRRQHQGIRPAIKLIRRGRTTLRLICSRPASRGPVSFGHSPSWREVFPPSFDSQCAAAPQLNPFSRKHSSPLSGMEPPPPGTGDHEKHRPPRSATPSGSRLDALLEAASRAAAVPLRPFNQLDVQRDDERFSAMSPTRDVESLMAGLATQSVQFAVPRGRPPRAKSTSRRRAATPGAPESYAEVVSGLIMGSDENLQATGSHHNQRSPSGSDGEQGRRIVSSLDQLLDEFSSNSTPARPRPNPCLFDESPPFSSSSGTVTPVKSPVRHPMRVSPYPMPTMLVQPGLMAFAGGARPTRVRGGSGGATTPITPPVGSVPNAAQGATWPPQENSDEGNPPGVGVILRPHTNIPRHYITCIRAASPAEVGRTLTQSTVLEWVNHARITEFTTVLSRMANRTAIAAPSNVYTLSNIEQAALCIADVARRRQQSMAALATATSTPSAALVTTTTEGSSPASTKPSSARAATAALASSPSGSPTGTQTAATATATATATSTGTIFSLLLVAMCMGTLTTTADAFAFAPPADKIHRHLDTCSHKSTLLDSTTPFLKSGTMRGRDMRPYDTGVRKVITRDGIHAIAFKGNTAWLSNRFACPITYQYAHAEGLYSALYCEEGEIGDDEVELRSEAGEGSMHGPPTKRQRREETGVPQNLLDLKVRPPIDFLSPDHNGVLSPIRRRPAIGSVGRLLAALDTVKENRDRIRRDDESHRILKRAARGLSDLLGSLNRPDEPFYCRR